MSIDKAVVRSNEYYQLKKDAALAAIRTGSSILVVDDNVLGLGDGTFYLVYSDGTLELIHKGVYELDGFVIGADNLIDGIDDLVHRMPITHDDGRAESYIRFQNFDSVEDRAKYAADLKFSIKSGLQYLVSEGDVK